MKQRIATLILLFSSLSQAEPTTLKIINWGEYIAPDLISRFEQQYNARVEYADYYSVEQFSDYFFNNANYYDVVFSPSRITPRLTELNMLEPLDTSKLPHISQLRPDVMEQYRQQENGSLHSIPYMWGTTGLGVNVKQLQQLGIADYKDSWALLFDPHVRAKAAQCGIGLLSERDELFSAALTYLGHSPNTSDKAELAAAGNLLKEAVQNARYVHANQYREDLTAGNICVAVGYSGSILEDIANFPDYAYYIPREGAAMWIDVMGVTSHAENPQLAYQFIDFLMQADNAAANTNQLQYPTAMASAEPLINRNIINNPAIYPPQVQLSNLEALRPQDKQISRIKHRLWVSALCSGRDWCSVPMTSFF